MCYMGKTRKILVHTLRDVLSIISVPQLHTFKKGVVMSGDWDMMYNTLRMPENTNLANIYALMCPNWCFLFLRCMKYLFSAEVQSNLLWIFWFLWLSKLLVLSRTPHRFQLTFSSDAISYNIFDGFFRQ